MPEFPNTHKWNYNAFIIITALQEISSAADVDSSRASSVTQGAFWRLTTRGRSFTAEGWRVKPSAQERINDERTLSFPTNSPRSADQFQRGG